MQKGANVSEMQAVQYLPILTGELCDEYDYSIQPGMA
jgi:hypothetical protein